MPFKPLEKFLTGIDSRYRLCIIASKRARQINEGSPVLVDSPSKKPISIALDEVAQGKIEYHIPIPAGKEETEE